MGNHDSCAIIECDKVSFGYQKGEVVLKEVSFQVFAHDFIGIIGPNGGGKSTLLKLLLGLIEPSSGTIRIFGKSPTLHPNSIGYVPQHLQFDKQFPLTVLDVVLQGRLKYHRIFCKYSQKDFDAAHTALQEVGLKDLANHAFGALSGGQTQRVLIARALASEPKLLLLDEPTANVDFQAEASILELLGRLSKHITIIMVTHNLRAIIEHVQKILCVQGKCTVMQTKEVCEHFALGLYHYPLIETPEQHLVQLPRRGS